MPRGNKHAPSLPVNARAMDVRLRHHISEGKLVSSSALNKIWHDLSYAALAALEPSEARAYEYREGSFKSTENPHQALLRHLLGLLDRAGELDAPLVQIPRGTNAEAKQVAVSDALLPPATAAGCVDVEQISVAANDPQTVPQGEPGEEWRLIPSGAMWEVRGCDDSGHLPDLAGVKNLVQLLRKPGQHVPWAELLALPDTVDRRGEQAALTPEAVAAIQSERRRLQNEVDGADNEVERADSEKRLAELDTHIMKDMGLGGKPRDLNDLITEAPRQGQRPIARRVREDEGRPTADAKTRNSFRVVHYVDRERVRLQTTRATPAVATRRA